MESLTASLERVFGYTTFRAGQQAALTALEDQKDTLAVLPTGAGKTLIYQLYGYRHPGCVLVVSPLLALMNDQVDRMRVAGFRQVAAVTSLTSFTERQEILAQLDQYRFLFLSPEMLAQPAVLSRIQQISLSLLVVDEAHCIVQWGPDFRPEYLLLGAIRERLGRPLTLLLTATADHTTRIEIAKQMRVTPTVVAEPIDRPNVFLDVETVANETEKRERLLGLVSQLQTPGVVYFSSKQQATDTASWLQEQTGLAVAAYHAGLSSEDRFKIQQQFMQDDLAVICATSAFGMGIDKNDIRFVIHYHLPADLGSYVQEMGRAGRDGQTSVAILLYTPGDERLPQALNETNRPDDVTIRRFYATPQHFSLEEPGIRLLTFYRDHGISEPAVHALFERRERERRAALDRMVAYVREPTCLRQNWLAAFDQTAPDHQAKTCCAPGNQDLDITALGLRRTPAEAVAAPNSDWRTQLAGLLTAAPATPEG